MRRASQEAARGLCAAFLVLAAGAVATSAPAAGQDVSWEASVRPRTETRDLGELETFFTSMQTRLGLAAALGADVRLYAQLQDVRFWGGASRVPSASANAFDLHQGFFELGHRGESTLWTRVGRQEMEFGNGRLVGAPEWSQTGRSFDGVRGAVTLGEHTVVDGFGMQLRESLVAPDQGDAVLWGAWGTHTFPGHGELSLFWLHDRDGDDPEIARSTVGVHHTGSLGPATVRLEGAWQGGEVRGVDLSGAYMVAASLGTALLQGRGSLEVGYDRYSGDASPEAGETGAFDDPYGRNHRFFGFADLFLDIPVQTDGRGIQDIRVRAEWGLPHDGRLQMDLHHFRVTDGTGLESGELANEVDLTAAWSGLMEGFVGIQAGASWAGIGGAGDVLLELVTDDVWFGYAMVQVAF
ncbi:MAG TPA: alginate export family protein [Longimicrobiales bacterium]|nr:alginate export family protein [Longimicrobiales bacterium]